MYISKENGVTVMYMLTLLVQICNKQNTRVDETKFNFFLFFVSNENIEMKWILFVFNLLKHLLQFLNQPKLDDENLLSWLLAYNYPASADSDIEISSRIAIIAAKTTCIII